MSETSYFVERNDPNPIVYRVRVSSDFDKARKDSARIRVDAATKEGLRASHGWFLSAWSGKTALPAVFFHYYRAISKKKAFEILGVAPTKYTYIKSPTNAIYRFPVDKQKGGAISTQAWPSYDPALSSLSEVRQRGGTVVRYVDLPKWAQHD